MSYGKEVDMERCMILQFGELLHKIPRTSVLNTNCENAEYVNYSSNLKNGYLVFDTSL
jgi:hypothetical protein